MGSLGTQPGIYCDVIVIGAGLSGLFALYRLRNLGFRVRVLEIAPDVGGTWYYNRYPGARTDSESYTYQFNIPELLEVWDWSEHFATQPEILRYVELMCTKFGLKKDIRFNTRICSAHWQDDDHVWLLTDQVGGQYRCRWLITAIGVLTVPTLPDIPGRDDFEGEAYHTARWPHQPVGFEGKRIAVIGTGASGIQVIQEAAKTAKHLTVFQRTPNWTAPARNSAISPENMSRIRTRYQEIFDLCSRTPFGFMHLSNGLATREAGFIRKQILEYLYESRGLKT